MKSIMFLIAVVFAGPSLFAAKDVTPAQIIEISVTENGFEPSQIDVKAGVPVILKVTRKTDATCATELQIPSKKIKKDLPLNKTVTFDIGKLDKGNLPYACGMDMLKGNLHIK
ncbi:cupredoxin domain-containing protein [Bdellovibrio sp. SKB1291214]|uniref:cupredoxin domain-containing protein n=1 Tax=Bdellovibrio sp. SKB1291214 TaxID=1732569 RepID=UPI000B5174D4|nr:cupredoxin domain-containing protein [Bdellovibrio sp. SKB1291214]UYL09892.1 cupredoxin domain-containing protein [Bdellovibrio sp. SKB1291214]